VTSKGRDSGRTERERGNLLEKGVRHLYTL